MIIVGYQGIGKSTLCKNNNDRKYIDFESSNFWIDGERNPDWYKIYVKIAVNLSNNYKFIVMLSSHEVVRNELKKYIKEEKITKDEVVEVFPDNSLKDEWIKKLSDRLQATASTKDYKALVNAQEMFDININDLKSEDELSQICIENSDYNLECLITQYIFSKGLQNDYR